MDEPVSFRLQKYSTSSPQVMAASYTKNAGSISQSKSLVVMIAHDGRHLQPRQNSTSSSTFAGCDKLA